MKNPFQEASISLQLPLAATAFCLAIGLALVALAATSSRFLQEEQQAEYGHALAQQIARRISTSLETGDLLSVAASLQRFVETSPATSVAIYDVEGKALGRADKADTISGRSYEASVRVGPDTAGTVIIALDVRAAEESRMRFLLSLSALAVLLSLMVFLLARYGSSRIAGRLSAAAQQLELGEAAADGNELNRLERSVAALPLELLRPRGAGAPSEEHYRSHAVLYLHLASLAGYIDTLNENNLHRYTDRLHQIIYSAASCYTGRLEVVRPFGLALCFNEAEGSGSAVLRAAACAGLIRSVATTLEKTMSLSLHTTMAIGRCELGPGDAADIYPGLYLQGALDSLRDVCLQQREHILVSEDAAADPDLAVRVNLRPEIPGYQRISGFASSESALIERQKGLMVARLQRRTGRS